jgi:putative transcriptional regulator
MPVAVDIDVMLARRKMSVGELADRIGITPANLVALKNGRAKAVRFATLAALCQVLECQPGDVLRWEPEDAPDGRLEDRAKQAVSVEADVDAGGPLGDGPR